MNRAALHAWAPLTSDGSVRWLKYTFGPGTANTLAARLDDGTWLVVSPAVGAPPHVFDELARQGPVGALIAPNPYHHLGHTSWRERFPDAVSYAVDGALPRLSKKSPGVPFRPASELRAGSRFELVVPDGLKTPDALLRVSTPGATVWWMGDLFSNNTPEDQVWFLRVLVAPLAGSGLGYRRNGKPGMVYVRDRASWLASIRSALTKHPPSAVVPAHGDAVLEDAASRTEPLLQ
jgi:hypothetical protein